MIVYSASASIHFIPINLITSLFLDDGHKKRF